MDIKDAVVSVLAIVCALLVLLSPAACTMRRQRVVAEMVERGASPIEAKCGVEMDTGSSPVCVAAAISRKPAGQ